MIVAEGVYSLSIKTPGPLKTVNSYLLKDGQSAYLVDTNWPSAFSIEHLGFVPQQEAWDALMGLFEEAKLDPKKLDGIIVTHAHADHIGYLPELQELTNAPALIHSHEIEAHRIRSGPKNTWRQAMVGWFRNHGTPAEMIVDIVDKSPTFPAIQLGSAKPVSNGEKIYVGSMCWEIVWTPGHSPGHICLFERQKGLLLTGDHVLPHDTPNIHAHPNLHYDPLGRYLESLRQVQNLPVKQAFPGHGTVINDLQSTVSHLLNHHDARFADVIASLRSGLKSSYEVACEIPWVSRRQTFFQLSHRERWMALSETIAHLNALDQCGIIKSTLQDTSIVWELIQDRKNSF